MCLQQSKRKKNYVIIQQIEVLKARPNKKEPDYQEMRELKEQIQLMRRELESRIEDNDDRPETPETPVDQQPPAKSPLILLPETEEETPSTKEYEQLKFDVSVGDAPHVCTKYPAFTKISEPLVESTQMTTTAKMFGFFMLMPCSCRAADGAAAAGGGPRWIVREGRVGGTASELQLR